MNKHVPPEKQAFLDLLRSSLEDGAFVKMTIGKYRGKDSELERVYVKRLTLKGVDSLSFLYRHRTQDITKNLPVADGLQSVEKLLGGEFRSGHLFTLSGDAQIEFSKKGKALLRKTKSSQKEKGEEAPAQRNQHNRTKHRFIDPGSPFLHRLGVTESTGNVIPSMSRKWKQINKFLETFSHALESAGLLKDAAAGKPLHVVDFGAGKGYLTLSVHSWLNEYITNRQTNVANKNCTAEPNTEPNVTVTGVELRENLVAFCNQVVRDLSLDGIHFHQGDISTFSPDTLDVMIALHACDVATDFALHKGIAAGAKVIMSAPCCHKELRPQMHSPAVAAPMLRHGIHLEQQAEMVTDSLRALLLEAHGYNVQVFEFVSLEHTSKNKMILAVQSGKPKNETEKLEEIRAIKEFYGIQHQTLEEMLKDEQ